MASSCCASSSEKNTKGEQAQKDVASPKPESQSRGLSIAPFVSALLQCSCCWLPALLDVFAIGSAGVSTVSAIQRLRPVFMAITVILLLNRFRRKGLTRENMMHVAITCSLLMLPRFLEVFKKPQAVPAKSCCSH